MSATVTDLPAAREAAGGTPLRRVPGAGGCGGFSGGGQTRGADIRGRLAVRRGLRTAGSAGQDSRSVGSG